jgi:hypothetical protein
VPLPHEITLPVKESGHTSGQIIPEAEFKVCDARAEQCGVSYRFIHMAGGKILDGSTSEDGSRPLTLSDNPCAACNNNKTDPNAELDLCQKAPWPYWLVARVGIARHAEISWWYGDSRRGLPNFMYE